ncbi:MAG TPA: NADPH:quinone oxidoreductase family protein [Xanthobacteraceae bacterium]|nr:NADPH:quinone oxidoreductase family protein [Xanthobacteraceae bacterium]
MRGWLSVTPGLTQIGLSQLPRPITGPGTALVRVEAAALNFSDLLMIDDHYQVRPPRPFVPGQEIAGTVISATPNSGLAEGDRIASKVEWGGFAEYAVVRGDMAMRLPGGMSASNAAALPVVYTTALVAMTESTVIASGETVLVLAAAGGVGLATVEIAKHLGARVIAAAGGTRKCALARAHGADETVDYRDSGWGDQVKALSNGRGVDVIVDPVGGEVTKQALRLLDWGGRLLIVGFSSGQISQIPANRLLLRRASAIGVYWDHDRDGPMLARIARKIFDLSAAGTIRPHIGETFAFEDLPIALAALRARETTGKSILRILEETT